MPARRRKQSNAMLYTLITFVGLFIATTTVAVIFYVKAEEYKTGEADLQGQLKNLATSTERNELPSTVGARSGRETYLGLLAGYFDQTVTMIVGGPPAPDSAEIKIDGAGKAIEDALNVAKGYISIADPNMIGLVQTIKDLAAALDSTTKAKLNTEKELADKRAEFALAQAANADKEAALQVEKEEFRQQLEQTKKDYADLSTLLQQTTSEQVKRLTVERDQLRNDLSAKNSTLLETQALLKEAQDRMKLAQEEVAKIEPGPDRAVLAQEPDGEVLLVDDKAKVVHLNIGGNEHVYPGLTFTVYDRGTAVTSDGKGKAEIKVFDVAETYSAARIVNPEISKPILKGDIVANLIWDADRTNVFAVAGDFDLDGDGQLDADATTRIETLVEKWGGKMADAITIDTDFLVLGNQPTVLQKPSLEEEEIDPQATAKYEASLQRLARYNQLRDKAQSLWIPVFTYEKFLHFVGYKSQVSQAGAI
ncbi:MAG: hypothetical protein ACYTE3_10970 [Planctomycetota bacterium]